MSADAYLMSAERHPHGAAAVAELFADHPHVESRVGDWQDVMRTAGPFDVLCMDTTLQVDLQPTQWDRITALIKVGGQIVMDDLTPVELWPTEWDECIDLKREFAFANPRVVSTEVRTTPTTAALIVRRRQ